MAMATKAIYIMISALNQPESTVNCPRTMPAVTLKGVLSMLGVLMAASRIPSMASSRIRNCQTMGTLTGSLIWIKASHSGTH